MSKQYCRYCANLCEGDCYYCSFKGVMNESQIKRANTCKYYVYTTAGDIITGKQYTPQMPGKLLMAECEQIEMEDMNHEKNRYNDS